MSGHSKWATIKRQKGANDAKRGQLFTKLAMAITIAVKEGAGNTDPNFNFKLRLAIDKARAANMPKENIERAIDRAKGTGAGDLSEVMYEGFAPGGVAVIVQAVTDNKMRTVSEIKNLFEKNGGAFGSVGSVSYLFTQKGELITKKNGKSFDDYLSVALETGVEDVEENDDQVIFYTRPTDLFEAKKNLEAQGLSLISSEIVYEPNTYIDITQPATREKIISFLEKIEDQDDVQKVFSNANFVNA